MGRSDLEGLVGNVMMEWWERWLVDCAAELCFGIVAEGLRWSALGGLVLVSGHELLRREAV